MQPNIITLYGASVAEEDLMLIVEFAHNGSLYEMLHNPAQVLSFPMRVKMLYDTAQGMAYLHGQDPVVIHRDLKSPNLLVMADMTVKVSDFGTSKWIQNTASMTANVGSALWSAPEVLRSSKYSEKADIYRYCQRIACAAG
jgi:serine/threonine protein kinase